MVINFCAQGDWQNVVFFEPVLLSILKNKERKRKKFGVLGEPPELRIACFSLNSLYCPCAFMLVPPRRRDNDVISLKTWGLFRRACQKEITADITCASTE